MATAVTTTVSTSDSKAKTHKIAANDASLQLPSNNKMSCIIVNNDNNNDPVLSLTSMADIPSDLNSCEVLIKVYATAVNRADLLQARGKYPPPKGVTSILGLECCGVIVARSNDCKRGGSITEIGTRVMALVPGGGYAQYCKCHESTLIEIPSNMDYTIGAAIPEAFLTAFQVLFMYGQAKLTGNNNNNNDDNKKPVVLIHAGASGVGTTLLQYCKLFNLSAFVTCGSDVKIERCIYQYGACGGYNYKLKHNSKNVKFDTFKDALLDQFPNGANVILDCVGQNYWKNNIESIAMDGKWVIYGFLSGFKIPVVMEKSEMKSNNDSGGVGYFDISSILKKRISIVGTTLRTRSNEYKEELVTSFSKYIVPLLNSGDIGPIVDCKFEMKNAQDAHEYVKQNKNIGKVVLYWN